MTEKDYEQFWNVCLAKLKEEITDLNTFQNFFYDTSVLSIENDIVTIGASNCFAVKILTSNFIEEIERIISEVAQTNYKVVIADKSQTNEIIKENKETYSFKSNLNPKYTFNNFVMGVSNREAYMAAYGTAMDLGAYYNPLFIYGKSGLGKTHLLHAVGNYVRDNKQNAKIVYRSVDDFVEEVVKAFKESGIEVLKDRYRDIDVLLLDDVQFLASKEKTKEVLFSIFNNLINSGKQIILTSDRPTSELKHLEDRLVSRFNQGLSVQIKDLEFDTAYQIACKKVETLNINGGKIDDEVLRYLAKNYAKDVRQLEGALNKLLFYSITFNPHSNIDMNLVKNTFEIINKSSTGDTLSIDTIKTAVSEYYSISISQLEGKQRTANIAIARHIAMYLCRIMLDVSLSQIGDSFGGKDHATVINAISKVDNLLKTDPNYIVVIKELKAVLKRE